MRHDGKFLPLILGLLLNSLFMTQAVHGQGLLVDSGENGKRYLLKLSGTAYNERFNDARAILLLAQPPPLSTNEYLVIIEGFPQKNTRNGFFWHSEDSTMSAFSTEITCDIPAGYSKQPNIHFFYLSPVLLESRVFLTQQEGARRKMAEKMALPTRVEARAGKLNLRIVGDQASGTVWIKGYDSVERAYVEYRASFSGEMTLPIEPRQRLRK